MNIVNRIVRCTRFPVQRCINRSINPSICLSINHPINRLINRSYFSNPSPRSLNEIVHLDKLHPLPPESIIKVWLDHHSDRYGSTAIGDVINQQQYEILAERAKMYPLFVLPLFRDPADQLNNETSEQSANQSTEKSTEQVKDNQSTNQSIDNASSTTPGKPAYETVVLNWQGDYLLFTSLASYQKHGSQAGPLLVCTLYPDLMHEKGIVLVRLEVLNPLIPISDAKKLLQFTWKFYSDLKEIEGGSEDWVHKFNKESATFNFDAFVDKVYQMR